MKNIIYISLFLMVITVPLILMPFKLDKNANLNENRKLAKRPCVSFYPQLLQKFPQEYTTYFNDNFGLRTTCLKLNFIIKYYLFNTSTSQSVIFGNDGWLFSAMDQEDEDYRGITNYNKQMLENLAFSLESKRVWLEKRGIKYLYIIAPNKTTIYGEFVPTSYNKIRSNDSLDDVVNFLKLHTKVNIIDLRPIL